jgi:predicted ribosomally synthesized peptide with nif11-like leader
MVQHLKQLLQNTQLQQQIKAAANQAEVIQLLLVMGAEKGYNFTVESVSQLLAELSAIDGNELSQEELLSVSGGNTSVYCPTTRRCG